MDPQLEQLRRILLEKDREILTKVNAILHDQALLKEKVNPIIEEQITFIKENFPEIYGAEVERAIEEKINESSELLLEAIAPRLGKLVRKAIAVQFLALRESIEQQLNNTFSYQRLIRRLKARLFGIKQSDIVLSNTNEYSAEIKEVYIIQRHSGLLMGSYSIDNTIDQDMIGGMLTAIKAFAEDAISGKEEELEMIQYGMYNIFMQGFVTYYVAVILNGALTIMEKEKLSEKITNFADSAIKVNTQNITSEYTSDLSQKLEKFLKTVSNDQ